MTSNQIEKFIKCTGETNVPTKFARLTKTTVKNCTADKNNIKKLHK